MKKNLFTTVKMTKPGRSVFDLSHEVKQTQNFGILYPSLVLECVPGDTINLGCEALVRTAPLVAPTMSRMNVFMHYFFVPNRLVWDGWEDYITQNDQHGATIPTHPYIKLDENLDPAVLKWLTYYGIGNTSPVNPGIEFNVNPIPFAAYNLIYNEYYRDQNIIESIPTSYELIDGDNTANIADLLAIRIRAWEHDYFTSALPWAQKGQVVDIPLGDVQLKSPPTYPAGIEPIFRPSSTHTGTLSGAVIGDTFGELNVGGQLAVLDPAGTLGIEATTINDLRRAFRLQEWYERQARGGTRYIEQILAHYGVKSSDARLQRPEYITGTKSPISISEVLQTSETSDTGTPQGNMAGHGISIVNGNYGKYFAEEHGFIIGICSIMPQPIYGGQVQKHYLKFTDPFELYWPEFANIGEQAIVGAELQLSYADLDYVFGYIPRYAEYKFINSRVAGEFCDSLEHWVVQRPINNNETLNQDFIECDPQYTIFAVTDDSVDHFYLHIYHKIRAIRPMPYYGTPTI